MQRLPRQLTILGIALLATAILAPVATQAQSVSNAATNFQVRAVNQVTPGNIPVDGFVLVKVDWTYSYQLSASAIQQGVVSSANLAWDPVKCEGAAKGIVVTGSFSEVIPLPSGASVATAKQDGSSQFAILASTDAPGETPITCTFSGKVLAQGALPQSNTASQSIPVKVAYRGLISATVPLTIQQAGPQKQISYTLQLQNLGNSESSISFTLKDEAPAGWSPVIPTPIILTTPNKGGTDNSKEVSFVISTPYHNGWLNKEQSFRIDVQPSSTKDNSETGKGPLITVNVLARVRGIYVPGPEPALVLLAAVGAVLVARRLNA